MRIWDDIYDAMLGHCRDEARRDEPREACGVLIGSLHEPDAITWWHPITNVHEQPDARFQLDPDAQVALWCGLDRLGFRPRIIYHSHLDDPAIMSEEDLRFANDPNILHMVVSLFRGQLASGASGWPVRLWSVLDGKPSEQPFTVAKIG